MNGLLEMKLLFVVVVTLKADIFVAVLLVNSYMVSQSTMGLVLVVYGYGSFCLLK